MMTTFMRVIQSKFTKTKPQKIQRGAPVLDPPLVLVLFFIAKQVYIIMIKVGFSIFRNLLMTTEPALNLCLVAYTFEITPRNTRNASLIRTEITLKMHNGL